MSKKELVELEVPNAGAITDEDVTNAPIPEGFEIGGTYYINPLELQVDYTQNGRRFGVKSEKVENLSKDFLNPEMGQLQEIGIFWNPKIKAFQVVYGYHRAAAAIGISMDGTGPDEGGIFLLRCYLMSIEDASRAMGVNLAENSPKNRAELTPMDKAYTVARMLENGYKQADIAERMGVSKALVSQLKHLVDFPLKIQKAIDRGVVTQAGAFELIPLKDAPDVMQSKVDEIVASGSTVGTAAVRASRREEIIGYGEEETDGAEASDKTAKATRITTRTLKEIMGFLRDFSDCEKDASPNATQQILKIVLKFIEGKVKEKAAAKAIDKVVGVV